MKSPRRASVLSLVALAASLLAATSSWAVPYSSVFVFGDSYSDSGNVALSTTFRSPLPDSNFFIPDGPYSPSETFSNGPVWATGFATLLGTSALPALAGGTNFAFGGARTGGPDIPVPTLTTQVGMFLGAVQGQAPPSALYVVAGIGNDARDTLVKIAGLADPEPVILADAASYASNMGNIVDTLQGAGAQNLVVINTGNIGLSPFARATDLLFPGFADLASDVAGAYDLALATRLAGEPGVTLFDIYAFTSELASSNRFANVTDACGANAGADCGQYMFWDGIHPTAATHQEIANKVFAQVIPEPATYALFALGIVAVMTAVRQRRC